MPGRPTIFLVLLALAGGCAPVQPAMGPPARPGQVVTGFSERLRDQPGFQLYLRNNTESAVTITSLTIYDCVNLAVWCETRELDIVLAPGQVRRMTVVVPDDVTRSWNFRWRWTHERGVSADARPTAGDPAPAPILLDETDGVRLLLDPRGRFVNLVLPEPAVRDLRRGEWTGEQVQRITRAFYRAFLDEFDFLMVALADEDRAQAGEGRAFRASRAAEGLGLRTVPRTEAFGSDGRLLGTLMLSSHSTLGGPLPLHELAHLWGQYVIDDTGHQGHWGFTGAGGLLGGWTPGTLEEVGDGLWTAREEGRPGAFSLSGPRGVVRDYAPIELYLMGLLPADSVPPIEVAEDGWWVDVDEGTFRASGIRAVTIDEVVERHGPRDPAYPLAASEFRGAYVVVSSSPLDDSDRNRIDQDVEDLARAGPRELRWYPNFWEATGGRGRIVMEALDASLREEARRRLP